MTSTPNAAGSYIIQIFERNFLSSLDTLTPSWIFLEYFAFWLYYEISIHSNFNRQNIIIQSDLSCMSSKLELVAVPLEESEPLESLIGSRKNDLRWWNTKIFQIENLNEWKNNKYVSISFPSRYTLLWWLHSFRWGELWFKSHLGYFLAQPIFCGYLVFHYWEIKYTRDKNW